MNRIYDARGNRYAVITPEALGRLGVAIPDDAAEAARVHAHWADAAIAAVCAWPEATPPPGAKTHRSDGLLVGPFTRQAPFDVLIINTDATLAERSGNGLTIFAQALTDSGLADQKPFTVSVHHGAASSPLQTAIEPSVLDGAQGFWLDLGTPQFGPHAVAAREDAVYSACFNERQVNRVKRLAAVNPDWAHSVFVRVGNPHCVTLLPDATQLPTFAALHESALNEPLTRIAFAAGELGAGEPCPAGVNLQWACLVEPGVLEARVFERGEGPTASSGTSATAVACAAWAAGLVQGGAVQVRMPGGNAPLKLDEQNGALQGVALFGVATRVV